MGACTAPTVAWRLAGVAPGAVVAGFESERGPALLIGGDRAGGAEPRLGDICIASPKGWGIRRLVAQGGLQGLPALLRRVFLAGGTAGALHVWPLGLGDREADPWKVDAHGPLRVGPLVVGATFVFAGGQRVCSVSDLIEPRWQVDVGALVEVPPACDGQTVFVAAGARLIALSAASGDRLWQGTLPALPSTGLLVTAGLVVAGFADGALRAFDAASGEAVWEQPVGASAFAPHLALAGPWLVAANAAGQLVAVDAAEGQPRWSAAAPGPLGSPTIGFGRAFVVGGDGQLWAVPFASDQPTWSYAPLQENGQPGRLVGVASIQGPRLYVTTADGVLVALDLLGATGPAPWPTPGGTPARNGRVVPPDAAETP